MTTSQQAAENETPRDSIKKIHGLYLWEECLDFPKMPDYQGMIMMTLEDIRKDRALLDSIDWSMTPEEAVTLYLEWGNNTAHGRKMVKSKKDVSHYFVVNTWNEPPMIYLVRRNSDEAVDLAAIELPPHLRKRFAETVARRKSVYGLTPEVKEWLQKEMGH